MKRSAKFSEKEMRDKLRAQMKAETPVRFYLPSHLFDFLMARAYWRNEPCLIPTNPTALIIDLFSSCSFTQ